MPDLAVVMPTLNRRRTLLMALERLAGQSAPAGSFEVIVVVDASEPEPEVIERDVAGLDLPTRLIRSDARGASAARNRGWRGTDAPLILFLDDDILARPRLVAEHLAWHREHAQPEVGVLGHVGWARELRVTPFMRWLDRGVQFDYLNITDIEAGWGRFYTANASVKRSLLEQVGGFDEERLPFGYEDLDLAYRMHALGFRLLYNERADAEHLHPMDLDFWRRRVVRIADAERRFVHLHPDIPAHFHALFSQAANAGVARGRGRMLIRFVPPGFPWLGPRVWRSADLYYRQQLAPHFLEAWRTTRIEDEPVSSSA